MDNFEKQLISYDYSLPPELIRKAPLECRSEARLLVYDTKADAIKHLKVKDLPSLLKRGTVMVRNVTRVLPVRLVANKKTGGRVELFILANELRDRSKVPALIGGSVKVGSDVIVNNKYVFKVLEKNDSFYYLSFNGSSLEQVIDECGSTPLPHYLSSTLDEQAARVKYQTVFAQHDVLEPLAGSVAAPTASLHFDADLLLDLETSGVIFANITLHVGRGTFAPLTTKNFESMRLHSESYKIKQSEIDTIISVKELGNDVLAVGTTAVRALEAYSKTLNLEGDTDIFITPPHDFTLPTMLMTNFHLPKTSLMLLVQAFLEHKRAKKHIKELYELAIREKYSFYSFGDSMLII